MNITRTTEPSTEPVTLDEAKAHLRVVDFTDDDSYITTLISVARRLVEDATGRTLIDTTFTQSARGWCRYISICRGNAQSISSIKYDPEDGGAEVTVSSSLYSLRPFGDGLSQVVFFDDFTEPSLIDRRLIDRIRIQFVAGYGAAATDVPEPLKQAVLYQIAHLYDNRAPVTHGSTPSKVPGTVDALISPYKIYN